MSALAALAAVALGAWLVVLTVVLLLVVRQLALVTYRVEHLGGNVAPRDGLPLAASLPREVTSAIPEAEWQRTYVLLTSSSCAPCQQLIPQLNRLDVRAAVVALLPGRGPAAEQMEREFPDWARVIRDPEATALARVLDIDRTPFAFELANGMVTAKTYVHSVADLARLMSDAGREARGSGRQLPEVPHVNADIN